jgi:hypothetical protein
MSSIMIARVGGMVTVDGVRVIVKKGRSTADRGHQVVAEHPDMWEPIRPQFAAPDAPDPVALAVADAVADVLTDAGHDVDPQSTLEDMLDQVRALLDPGAERSEGAASNGSESSSADDPSTPQGRAAVRAWAAEQGIEVAPTGRLSHSLVEQWERERGGAG